MAAIMRDSNISTEIMIDHGNDWIREVKNIWRPGDILACYPGQKIGLMRKPLEQVLRSTLKASIYILSNEQPVKKPMSRVFWQGTSWLGSFAIIGGFFWVESKIVELPQDWAHTSLLYVCIFVEIALIWLWNSIFS
jgi:hypothetical protein